MLETLPSTDWFTFAKMCSFKSRILGLALVFLLVSPSAHGADTEEDKARRKSMHYYMKGRHIFQSQCIPCHGKTGRGNGPWAENLTDKPRNFKVGIFKFRTTPYGKLPTNDDLRRTIRNGISGTAMPFFKKLTDADVNGLIVYLQNLSKRWDDEENFAEPIPLTKTPEWFQKEEQVAAHSKAGATKFAEICAACHGPEGKGDGLGTIVLLDVWNNQIVPADLTNEHHKSGDAATDLYRTIATGLDGTPMLGFYQTLKEKEIWDLVAFIKSNEVDGQRVDVKVGGKK